MLPVDREQLSAAIPGYEVGDEIGRGATGLVFAACHRQLGRDVAVKALPPALAADPLVKRRFVEEAKVLASFNHVHIVPIYDFVDQDDLCLLVMERLAGGTLAAFRRDARGSGETACALALATCSALHYAHQKGVLHRDVKPENALFADDGTLKVTDFGIAKVLSGAATLATRTGFVLGTPAYMSPEQALGEEVTPATDVYAVGVVLYWMLSGRLPFASEGNPLEVLSRRLHSDPPPLETTAPGLHAGVASAVMRALERDPSERWETAEAFGVAIADAATGAWGAGWLKRTGAALGAAGPIAEAVHGSRGRAPAPTMPSSGDVLDVEPADLVPVGAIVDAPAPPARGEPPGEPARDRRPARRTRMLLTLATALLAAGAVAAIVLLARTGGDEPGPGSPSAGPPLRAGSPWRVLRPAPTERQQLAATVLGGEIWVIGGLRTTGEDRLERAGSRPSIRR